MRFIAMSRACAVDSRRRCSVVELAAPARGATARTRSVGRLPLKEGVYRARGVGGRGASTMKITAEQTTGPRSSALPAREQKGRCLAVPVGPMPPRHGCRCRARDRLGKPHSEEVAVGQAAGRTRRTQPSKPGRLWHGRRYRAWRQARGVEAVVGQGDQPEEPCASG